MSKKNEKSRKEILSNNIRKYLEVNGLKENEAAALASLNASTLNSWICKVSYPREGNLRKLADALHVGVEDLMVEKKEQGSTAAPYLAVKENDLLSLYHSDQEFSRFVNYGFLAAGEDKLKEVNGALEEILHCSTE